jgi:hypothetical protein
VGSVFDNSLVVVECNDCFVEPERKSGYAGFESWKGREVVAVVHPLLLERKSWRESLVEAAGQTLSTASGAACR